MLDAVMREVEMDEAIKKTKKARKHIDSVKVPIMHRRIVDFLANEDRATISAGVGFGLTELYLRVLLGQNKPWTRAAVAGVSLPLVDNLLDIGRRLGLTCVRGGSRARYCIMKDVKTNRSIQLFSERDFFKSTNLPTPNDFDVVVLDDLKRSHRDALLARGFTRLLEAQRVPTSGLWIEKVTDSIQSAVNPPSPAQ